MTVRVTSPTRVDFAGGTLDCWPLYALVGGAVTTNLAISVFTEAVIEPRDDGRIVLVVDDLDYRREFSNLQAVLDAPDPELSLLRVHLAYQKPALGFSLRTRSESPVGGGLGGSSSLSISLIRAFDTWAGRQRSVPEMVTLAGNLEAEVLRMPTGTQDYFPAAAPGLSLIEYGPEGPKQRLVPFPEDFFSQHMVLVYTGVPHHSGLNNWQIIKSAIEGDVTTLQALRELAAVSFDMAAACSSGAWQDLPTLFAAETAYRMRLSSAFSSPATEKVRQLGLAAGAEAFKICGAGGGGCVMLWVGEERRAEVVQECQKNGYRVIEAKPVGTPLNPDFRQI